MNTFAAIILAIIEGITEYLPVSSTGHMIIGSSMMGIAADDFTKLFTVAIQFGAILSVIVLYWKRFLQHFDFYLKLLVAFIPAAILGKLFGDVIDGLLENVIVVAIMLVLGGIILIVVDKWIDNRKTTNDDITYPKAFKVGLFQCLALVPGVSRSAATIIGGIAQGFSRTTAAEFSFFLAVPTMFAATVYKMYQYIKLYGAFFVAMLAIKTFIEILNKYGFKVFGYYRIAVGVLILALYYMGYSLQVQ